MRYAENIYKKKKFSYVMVLKDIFPCKGDSFSKVITKILFLLILVVIGASSFFLFNYFYIRYETNNRNLEITEYYKNSEYKAIEIQSNQPKEYFSLLSGASKLLEMNPDTVGYIEISGTNISFPVVQIKNSEIGNKYYLTHDFDKQENECGAIFMDWRNSFDNVVDNERVTPNSDNLIIYGHNMRQNMMFGELKKYNEDYSYYSEHPLINLNSNYSQYIYKIFGVCIVDGEDKSENAFEYYNVINFNTEEEFYDYVNGVKRRTLIINDVDVKYGDKLLTLSTCDTVFDDARLIIVARLLRDGEDPYEGTENNSRNPNPLMPDEFYKWNNKKYDSEAEFVPYG